MNEILYLIKVRIGNKAYKYIKKEIEDKHLMMRYIKMLNLKQDFENFKKEGGFLSDK